MDWRKHFDAVFCLSLADFKERRARMMKEFDRVGLDPNGILLWKLTVRNPFYRYIWTHPAFPAEQWWLDLEGPLNGTMGHYEIMKECLAIGYDRVLICEDDIRFLKDLGELERILEATPENDICLYDKNAVHVRGEYHNAVRNSRVNYDFIDYAGVKLLSAACYSVNRKAMEAITASLERNYAPIDDATNTGELRKVAAIKNLAVQDMRLKGERMTDIDRILYDGIADLDEYNL